MCERMEDKDVIITILDVSKCAGRRSRSSVAEATSRSVVGESRSPAIKGRRASNALSRVTPLVAATLAFPPPNYPHHSSTPIPRNNATLLPTFAMALATKTQSQNIFTKLKAKSANKVCLQPDEGRSMRLTVVL